MQFFCDSDRVHFILSCYVPGSRNVPLNNYSKYSSAANTLNDDIGALLCSQVTPRGIANIK